jgi:hypothetical protein
MSLSVPTQVAGAARSLRLRYGLDDRGSILPSSPRSDRFEGPSLPCNRYLGDLPLGVKQLVQEAYVKNVWSYTSIPPYTFMAPCLVKHRNTFTFPFILTLSRSIMDDKKLILEIFHNNARIKPKIPTSSCITKHVIHHLWNGKRLTFWHGLQHIK